MIEVPFPVTIAAYAVSGAVLLHTIVHSAKDAPKGTDVAYWQRVVRAWRHRRNKRSAL